MNIYNLITSPSISTDMTTLHFYGKEVIMSVQIPTGLVWISQCNVYSRRASSHSFAGDDWTYQGYHNQGQSRPTWLFLIDVNLAKEDVNYKVVDVIAGDYGVQTVHWQLNRPLIRAWPQFAERLKTAFTYFIDFQAVDSHSSLRKSIKGQTCSKISQLFSQSWPHGYIWITHTGIYAFNRSLCCVLLALSWNATNEKSK